MIPAVAAHVVLEVSMPSDPEDELKKDGSSPSIDGSYLDVISEAIKAVPEVKWALAVVGVISGVGLVVGGLRVNPLLAVFGFIVMLIFMIAMVLFAHGVKGVAQSGGLESKILIWFGLGLFMASATALFGSAIGNIPWSLRDRIQAIINGNSPHPKYAHEFSFTQPKFNVSIKGPYYYGVSSLGTDPTAKGKRISISKIRVQFDGDNHGQMLCCDVWVYIGSHPFPFPTGGGQLHLSGYSPNIIADNEGLAEVKLKVVIGTAFGVDIPMGVQVFVAEYDYNNRSGTAVPKLASVKEAFSNPIPVDDAIYAQVLIWEGAPQIDFDVTNIRLEIIGNVVGEAAIAR
jgi:hypothetical protein